MDTDKSPCSAKVNYGGRLTNEDREQHGGWRHPGLLGQTVPGGRRAPGLGSGARACSKVQLMWRIGLYTKEEARLQTALANKILAGSSC